MADTLVHSRMLTALAAFFPTSGSIQQRTETRNAAGQPVATWTTNRYTGVVARVQPASGREVKRADGITTTAGYSIMISGSYPGITTKDRFFDGVNAYDIVGIDRDAANVMTRLAAEIVT